MKAQVTRIATRQGIASLKEMTVTQLQIALAEAENNFARNRTHAFHAQANRYADWAAYIRKEIARRHS